MILSNEGQVRIVGTEIDFENEPTINTGNIKYQIADVNKRAWSMDAPIIITPSPEPDDTYEIDYANGYILFHKQKDRGELLVSGKYFSTTTIGKVLGYSLDKTRNFEEFTPLGSLHKESYPTELNVSGNIETLEVLDTYFLDVFESAERVLLDFQMGDRIESYWVYLEGISNEHNGGELLKKNITFRSSK